MCEHNLVKFGRALNVIYPPMEGGVELMKHIQAFDSEFS